MTRPWGLLACQGSYIRRSAPIYLPIFAVQSKKVRSIPAPDILLMNFVFFNGYLADQLIEKKSLKFTKVQAFTKIAHWVHELDWFKPTITFHVDIFNSSKHFRSTTKPTSRTVCLLKLVAWHAGLRHPKHPEETVGSCWHTHTPSPDLFIWNGMQKLLSGQERTSIKVPVLRSESIQYVGIHTVSSWSMTLCP